MSCYFNTQYSRTYLTSSCWRQQDFSELSQGSPAPQTVRHGKELNVRYWVEAVGISVNGQKHTLQRKDHHFFLSQLHWDKEPHQPASLSVVYLIPKPSFMHNCRGSEDSFPHREWEIQGQTLGRCNKGSAIRRERTLSYSSYFCSVPFSPCSVNKCAFCYAELFVSWLWLSSVKELPSQMPL